MHREPSAPRLSDMGKTFRICCLLLLVEAMGLSPARAEGPLAGAPEGALAEAIATTAPSSAAASTVRRVQERYDATETFSGRFVQEVAVGVSGRVVRSGGQLQFRKPGRMRWEYEASAGSEHQILIADGETLWIYQPEQAQVLRAPLSQAFASSTPVSFLFGVARLEEDFTAELLEPAEDGSLRLRLHPKDKEEGAGGGLVLEVDPTSFDLRAAVVRDPLGNQTRVALMDIKRNLPLDDALFVFNRPPGTDVQQAPTGR